MYSNVYNVIIDILYIFVTFNKDNETDTYL